MAFYKISYMFTQQADRIGGWTENLWLEGASDTYASFQAALMLPYISALHGTATYSTGYRYQQQGGGRASTLVTNPFGAPGSLTDPNVSDYPTTAVALRMMTGDGRRLTQWIKGVPDSVITKGGHYTPDSTYTGKMNAFIGQLLQPNSPWRLRVLDNTKTYRPVTNITQAGVVSCPGYPFDNTTQIRIKGVKGLSVANGIWRLSIIDLDTFQLLQWTTPSPATPYVKCNSQARALVPTFVGIAGCQAYRATSHKVGRPFGQLSGRRRTRRS